MALGRGSGWGCAGWRAAIPFTRAATIPSGKTSFITEFFSMAESVNGGSNTPAQPPKEMSMEVRLLLAFLLMGAVMFLTPYFFKSQIPPAGEEGRGGADCSQGTPGAPATAGATTPPAPLPQPPRSRGGRGPCPPTPRRRKPSPPFVIDTDLYRIAFSNQGATVRSWQLKKIQGQRQQDRSTWSTPRPAWISRSRSTSRARSPRPTSTGPGTSRPPIPTGSASPTSSPTATSPCARSSASRRTAIFRWSPPKSRWTASRCPT